MELLDQKGFSAVENWWEKKEAIITEHRPIMAKDKKYHILPRAHESCLQSPGEWQGVFRSSQSPGRLSGAGSLYTQRISPEKEEEKMIDTGDKQAGSKAQ